MFNIPQINLYFSFFSSLRIFLSVKFSDLNTFAQDFWMFEHVGKAVDPNGPLDIWKFKKFHLERTSGVDLVMPGRVQAAWSGIMSFIDHILHSVCTQNPCRKIWMDWVII